MEDLKFKTAENVMRDNLTTTDADFYSNRNKGFAMLMNGYRISVQWGPGITLIVKSDMITITPL